jgi:hypothetical protein
MDKIKQKIERHIEANLMLEQAKKMYLDAKKRMDDYNNFSNIILNNKKN